MTSRVRIEDELASKKRKDGLVELVVKGVVVTVNFTDISDLKRAVKLMEESHITLFELLLHSRSHNTPHLIVIFAINRYEL